MRIYLLSLTALLLTGFTVQTVQASDKAPALTIHAAEIGIGKFHRYDDQVHGYADDNVWKHYVLAKDADTTTPRVVENKDKTITIFFSSLDELLTTIEKVSAEKAMKVEVLNINGHGMPGQMWFPKDEATKKSSQCNDWVKAAQGDDKGNYDQYYEPVPKGAIMQYRALSKLPSLDLIAGCTTGAKQWTEIVGRHPNFKSVFTSDAQLHLFSCIVGLGRAGTNYVRKMSALLFNGENAKVEASTFYGLGDWSMPEGMGFWDYQNDDQLNRDNAAYPVNRKDRDLMQKGGINLAFNTGKKWEIGVVNNLDYMLGVKDSLGLKDITTFADEEQTTDEVADQNLNGVESLGVSGMVVQIPHTSAYVMIQ